MSRVLLACICVACGNEPAPTTVPAVLETDSYTAPIPDGFERSDQLPNAIVATERRPHASSFLSSVVVNPIRYATPDQRKDLSQIAVCEAESRGIPEIVRAQGHEPSSFTAELIELPTGTACRYRVDVEGDRPMTTVGTALQSEGADFMVVCNIARDDQRASDACDTFVQRWQWK